mgnify:CR=1 FL=1
MSRTVTDIIIAWLERNRALVEEAVGRLEFHIGADGQVVPALYLTWPPEAGRWRTKEKPPAPPPGAVATAARSPGAPR